MYGGSLKSLLLRTYVRRQCEWPDWLIFRLLGDFLWAVFLTAEAAHIFGILFSNGKSSALIFYPGTDVMTTIFCDFCQFSAEKIGVFLKNQCYDQIFA
jgi:hypothetical protein